MTTSPSVTPDVATVAVMDRGWLIALTESQVAFALAIASVTAAGIAARRSGQSVPRLLLAIGAISAAGAVPLLLAFTSLPVFIVTNQLRFVWVIAVAIWLFRRGTSPSTRPRPGSSSSSDTPSASGRGLR